MAAARQNRHGYPDATMTLIAFRHGLRALELVQRAVLHVRRAKHGTPSVHPLTGSEMRALRRLQRERERRALSTSSASAGRRSAASAGLRLKVQPRMLRHACGFALANAGHGAPCRHILGTRTSSIRCATRSWLPTVSKISGRERFLEGVRILRL
jgi:integrase